MRPGPQIVREVMLCVPSSADSADAVFTTSHLVTYKARSTP
jgi:hypothetical protein